MWIKFYNRKVLIMTCHIIGCGESGWHFPQQERPYYCIGVNDAGKFGYKFDELLFLNRPRHFNELGSDLKPRIEIIKNTEFKSLIVLSTLVREWSEVFSEKPVVPLPTLTRWAGQYKAMTCYHTNNSPFTAMSYATLLGFSEIVLWGVDFNNHKHLQSIECVPAFSQFATEIGKYGTKIYKGHESSKLNLPIWKSLQ
jgi:hypothetical protein